MPHHSYSRRYVRELLLSFKLSDFFYSQEPERCGVLKRKGRDFLTLSPFTNEKTPSFVIYDRQLKYHCYSSQEQGTALRYLQWWRNMTFNEAVEFLAAWSHFKPKPRRLSLRKKKKGKTS